MKILKIAFVMASALLSICANGGNLVDGKVGSKILGADVDYRVYLPDGFGKGDRQ